MNTRSTPAAFARGLISLVALLALLVAVPYILFQIGVLTHHVPSLSQAIAALTRQDTGQLFLGAITLIGWYGWLSFAVSALVEGVSALRQRKAPRVKLLGGTQRLAGTLVGGIILLLPTSAAFASSPPAMAAVTAAAAPAVMNATAPTTAPAAATSDAATSTPQTYTGPVLHVKAGDSLWEIAEDRLGSGLRWRDIVEANKGVPQADGTTLTEDSTILQPGWILRLPADATPDPGNDPGTAGDSGALTQAGPTAAAQSTHTVRAGETLSSIAKDELGSANDYRQIADLNTGVQQPDGRSLTDPDEIYPGWVLRLPAAENSSHRTPQQAAAAPAEPAASPRGGDTGQDTTTAPAPQPTAPAPAPQHSLQAQPPGNQHAPAPSTAGTAPADQAPAAGQTSAGSSDQDTVRNVAAAGSILAAAVLAVVATRRARQQRRRRAKRRIPMPEGATAQFEKQLRVASDVSGIELADRALRTLAANCRAARRPLPEVEAVRITHRGLELHLSAATPPVAPFTEQDGQPGLWWCPAHGARLLSAEEAADITAPYPALVSLGHTDNGDPVLVDLETVGLLRLDGTPANVRAVLLALAVELASSTLADDAKVVFTGAGRDLGTAYPDRIDHHADLAGSVPELQAHDAFQRAALAGCEADHLRAARLSDDASGDSWIPKVLMSAAPPTGAEAAALEDVLSTRPRTSVAVITSAGADLRLPGSWTLPAAPGVPVELPGLDLTVTLQYLDDDSYDRLVQLLVTSSRTDDVPAPAWTQPSPDAIAVNGPLGAITHEESALAPETNGAGPPQSPAPHVTLTPAHPVPPTAAFGTDLATAVPDFAALSPSFAAQQAATAPRPEGDDGADDSSSALAPAVAGYDETPADEDQAGEDHGSRDAADAEADPGEDASWDEETAADGRNDAPDDAAESASVWDQPGADAEFSAVLTEVLSENASSDPADDATGDIPGEGDGDSALAPAALGQSTTEITPQRRYVTKVSAATSTVLVALTTPPDPPGAPQIRVLGPVNIVGTLGKVESNRRNGLVEIAAWLILHPGLNRQDLDEAIWPGLRIRADTRNTAVSKLRSWVGRDPLLPPDDPNGAYLPPVTAGVYTFSDEVSSDWGQFQSLYQQGMHHEGQDADVALAQALALVRGRPFGDIDPAKYIWAENDIQEMISAIVDVAHELAERRRTVRDYRAAANAAAKGLTCDPQSELLYRDLFTIYHELGDHEGLTRVAHQLTRINVETGCDSSPETVGLLRTLLTGDQNTSREFGSAAS